MYHIKKIFINRGVVMTKCNVLWFFPRQAMLLLLLVQCKEKFFQLNVRTTTTQTVSFTVHILHSFVSPRFWFGFK